MNWIIKLALSFLNTPYKWGGNSPLQGGLDCSGFVQILMRAGGIHPGGDLTAQGIYDLVGKNGSWNKYGPGGLVFYGKSPTRVTHVAFMLDDKYIIEAAGGGQHTLSVEDAAKLQDACVRIRPVDYRDDKIGVIRPHWKYTY